MFVDPATSIAGGGSGQNNESMKTCIVKIPPPPPLAKMLHLNASTPAQALALLRAELQQGSERSVEDIMADIEALTEAQGRRKSLF